MEGEKLLSGELHQRDDEQLDLIVIPHDRKVDLRLSQLFQVSKRGELVRRNR